jgi:hypothetical protein
MSLAIRISVGDLELEGHLNDTSCAQAIADALPLQSKFRVWGDEIYFDIPVEYGLQRDAREEFEIGDLGYWPEGNALCIFFGPTPMSPGEKPVAYSRVNLVGSVQGAEGLRKAKEAREIIVEAAE